MRKVTICVLAKYPEILAEFKRSVDAFVPPEVPRIVVVDGDLIPGFSGGGWSRVQGPKMFSMAANYNAALRAVDPDSDVVLFNDDVTFLEPMPIEKLQALAYSEPRIGMVSAHVKIGAFANHLQTHPRQDVPITFVKTSGNGMAAYMRRDMLNEVGLFDESFTEQYGAEDADMTWRVNLAGWKVGIARDVPVKHGYRHDKCGSTSRRALGIQQIQQENAKGVARFKNKWGHFSVLGEWDWTNGETANPKRNSRSEGQLY